MRPGLRILAAVALLAAWLLLLFSGHILRGAAHVLFAAALAVFPWREPRRSGDASR